MRPPLDTHYFLQHYNYISCTCKFDYGCESFLFRFYNKPFISYEDVETRLYQTLPAIKLKRLEIYTFRLITFPTGA